MGDEVVCEVAREVVYQKFAHVPHLADRLLKTGDSVIAEMTRNDCNWGTGLDVGHIDASRPQNWRGTNILGWALMVARAQIRHDLEKGGRATAGVSSEAATAPMEVGDESSDGQHAHEGESRRSARGGTRATGRRSRRGEQ